MGCVCLRPTVRWRVASSEELDTDNPLDATLSARIRLTQCSGLAVRRSTRNVASPRYTKRW